MFNCTEIPKIHYDYRASMRLMHNNANVVQELTMMLKTALPKFKAEFQKAIHEYNIDDIRMTAHKLHGGVCYVSVPKLAYLVYHLETACKKYPEEIDHIIAYLIPSIEALEAELSQFVTGFVDND
ncbi:MAG: hypothetical protein LRY67_03640 [Gammaproteobacteria bacterium]|nr:hypothetical protein [Gammaproteobacteria bacterium]MCD8542194.1 hypothetical protein [Gammaproteobacteria bacterium]